MTQKLKSLYLIFVEALWTHDMVWWRCLSFSFSLFNCFSADSFHSCPQSRSVRDCFSVFSHSFTSVRTTSLVCTNRTFTSFLSAHCWMVLCFMPCHPRTTGNSCTLILFSFTFFFEIIPHPTPTRPEDLGRKIVELTNEDGAKKVNFFTVNRVISQLLKSEFSNYLPKGCCSLAVQKFMMVITEAEPLLFTWATILHHPFHCHQDTSSYCLFVSFSR